jgi:hypothetical protein
MMKMKKRSRAIIMIKSWRQTQLISLQLMELALLRKNRMNMMKLRARATVPGHSSLVSPPRPSRVLTTSTV